jgi:hypothetical protein
MSASIQYQEISNLIEPPTRRVVWIRVRTGRSGRTHMFSTRPAAIIAGIARVTSKCLVGRRIAQIGLRTGIAFVMSATRSTARCWRWGIIRRIVRLVRVVCLWIVCLVSVVVGWRRWERVGSRVELVALRCWGISSVGTHWWRRVWPIVCIPIILFFSACIRLSENHQAHMTQVTYVYAHDLGHGLISYAHLVYPVREQQRQQHRQQQHPQPIL